MKNDINIRLMNSTFNTDLDFLEQNFINGVNHTEPDIKIFSKLIHHFHDTRISYVSPLYSHFYLKVSANKIRVHNYLFSSSHGSLTLKFLGKRIDNIHHLNHWGLLSLINDFLEIESYLKHTCHINSNNRNDFLGNTCYGLLLAIYNDIYLYCNAPMHLLPTFSIINTPNHKLHYKVTYPTLVTLREYSSFVNLNLSISNNIRHLSTYKRHIFAKIVANLISHHFIYENRSTNHINKPKNSNNIKPANVIAQYITNNKHATNKATTSNKSNNHVLHTLIGAKIHSLEQQVYYYKQLYNKY